MAWEGMAPGDLRVQQSGSESGMVSRDLIVAPGCVVELRGMVGRNVVLGAGADVTVKGMIGGEILRDDTGLR